MENTSTKRQNFSSGASWERVVGYSRAVRVGNIIEITGTVALADDNTIAGGASAYEQTKFILDKIRTVLETAGGSLEHVVRTRMFVTDISRWEEYGRAHGEVFANIRPCTTMVEVSRLIEPGYLIEIEASAIL